MRWGPKWTRISDDEHCELYNLFFHQSARTECRRTGGANHYCARAGPNRPNRFQKKTCKKHCSSSLYQICTFATSSVTLGMMKVRRACWLKQIVSKSLSRMPAEGLLPFEVLRLDQWQWSGPEHIRVVGHRSPQRLSMEGIKSYAPFQYFDYRRIDVVRPEHPHFQPIQSPDHRS